MDKNRKTDNDYLKVQRWGINGEGIAFRAKKPIFIPGAVPGEEVEVSIVKKMPKYSIGKLETIKRPSSKRQTPPCPHSKECGGCALMHVDYRAQVQMKEEMLRESLKKYAGYDGKIEPLRKNPNVLQYRNACKLPVGIVDGRIMTGMYARNTQTFQPVETCPIHEQLLESTRNEILGILNEYKIPVYAKDRRPGLRTLVMKCFDGKVQVVLVTSPMDIDPKIVDAIAALPQVVSVWQTIKTDRDGDVEVFGKIMRHLAGEEKISLELDGLQMKLLPRSFFQLNTAQAAVLYDTVKYMMPEGGLVVEAYSGIGGIALVCADKAEKIIGIESVQDAVTNADENAKLNGIHNVEFVCGDAAEELENIADNEDIKTLIVDPPRTGLQERMLEAIKFAQPENIVYVSCNPSTLGKDLGVLKEWYRIKRIQPIDMFSQTSHLETVVKLEHR